MKRKKKEHERLGDMVKGLLGQPEPGFYHQPVLHINCRGQIEVENCKEILLYNEEVVRLDLGHWEISLFGNELELCSMGRALLTLRGKVFRAEFTYKE